MGSPVSGRKTMHALAAKRSRDWTETARGTQHGILNEPVIYQNVLQSG